MIEFMMFVCVPVIFILSLFVVLFADNSESALLARQKRAEDIWGADSEDDEQNYKLQREMSQYYKNEIFDRQQGDK
jgi:hypothetical protein